MPRPRLRRPSRRMFTLAMTGLCTPMAVATLLTPPAVAESLRVPASGSITVTMRGNGHGHGMSQYGARGAALAGLSYQQIVAFYYPNTALRTRAGHAIRVQLSDVGHTTTVSSYATLAVTGVQGVLPNAGVRGYRLVAASGSGLTLQKRNAVRGAPWRAVRTGLADHSAFYTTNGRSMRLWRPDGSSTFYFGQLRANRSSGGDFTVNRVSLDHYTAGVVPREMPSSWPRAAVAAQAVAARTYAAYSLDHPRASRFDICDTTSCQVYGGHLGVDASGTVVSHDYATAATDTTDRVLTYGGDVIFAEFSASNGGWTSDGGKPYLVAKADPYDNAASGDPYLGYAATVSAASLARHFGLAALTGITVVSRDGHGSWGGRITGDSGAVVLVGKDAAGQAMRVGTSGYDLQWMLGVGTTWMSFAVAS